MKLKLPERNKNNSKRKEKVKQGHKLVWLTLIIIAIPCIIVGYVLLTSMEEQNAPVAGNRFTGNDISPQITNTAVSELESEMLSIEGVESASANLLSATLRVHLNMVDDASEELVNSAIEQAYEIVNTTLPIETYFTNTDDGKMYDLEIDAYNYIVDADHPAEQQIYIVLTKTGAGNKVVDVMTTAKDPELVSEIKRETTTEEDASQEESEDETYYD
jgi:NADH:ubiquinone oxidoreductase subunit 5 (subunit L)/multisubunit Na+/H+ antiporter MnhA subunit